jgi:cobalt-zinc-cadmium efflux system protein
MKTQVKADYHAQGKALYIAIGIASVFIVIEIVGGIISNSLALMSDAIHLAMDTGALLLSLIILKIAHLPRTPKLSYGYYRAEVLGALASALSLWGICGVLLYKAIKRFIVPEVVNGPILFIVALVGLVANIVMLRVLHPSHKESINIRAAYIHVLGDLLGSVGVVLGGLIVWITHWNPIDPIITIAFTLGIVYGTGKIITQTVHILMESTPEGINPIALEKQLLNLQDVAEVHDLHIWTVSPGRNALSVHLVTSQPKRVLQEAHAMIEKNFKIRHMTIQIEDPTHFDPKYCYDCILK